MPNLDSITNQIAAEWRILQDAPIAFLSALVVVAILMCGIGIVAWVDSATIAGQDATIETLKTELDACKGKLGGASPDQAKAQIDDLAQRLARIEPRHLTDGQLHAMSKIINVASGHYDLTIDSDMTRLDCSETTVVRPWAIINRMNHGIRSANQLPNQLQCSGALLYDCFDSL